MELHVGPSLPVKGTRYTYIPLQSILEAFGNFPTQFLEVSYQYIFVDILFLELVVCQ